MLPQNAITLGPLVAVFLPPDDLPRATLRDYERGGVGIGDASQGRLVQDWTCFVVRSGGIDEVYAAPSADLASRTLLLAGENITSVSIAFDALMRPVVAFSDGGMLKLHWYDSTAEGYVTTSFPDATRGQVCADDKRPLLEGQSDVIFAYTRGPTLYWRMQRERYLVEREVGTVPENQGRLTVGMNAGWRLQFRLA